MIVQKDLLKHFRSASTETNRSTLACVLIIKYECFGSWEGKNGTDASLTVIIPGYEAVLKSTPENLICFAK